MKVSKLCEYNDCKNRVLCEGHVKIIYHHKILYHLTNLFPIIVNIEKNLAVIVVEVYTCLQHLKQSP